MILLFLFFDWNLLAVLLYYTLLLFTGTFAVAFHNFIYIFFILNSLLLSCCASLKYLGQVQIMQEML